MNRRTVLSTLGASAALGGLSGVSAGKGGGLDEEFERIIEQANRFRAKVDKAMAKKARSNSDNLSKPTVSTKYGNVTAREAWRKFLEDRNVNVATKRFSIPFESKEKEGLSTQKVENVDSTGVDAELALAFTEFGGTEYYTELNFRLYFGYLWKDDDGNSQMVLESWGEDPFDTMGLGWNENCWDWKYPYDIAASTKSSPNVVFEDSTWSLGSIGFEVDDREMYWDWRDSDPPEGYSYSFLEWGGAWLITTESSSTECYDNEDTTVLGVYDHTWTGSYGGFSVSVGLPTSISISYSNSTMSDVESTTTESDGTTPLRISKDNAEFM